MALVAVGLTYVLVCGEIDLAVGMTPSGAPALCGWLYESLAAGSPGAPFWLVAAALLVPPLSCLILGVGAGLLTVCRGCRAS